MVTRHQDWPTRLYALLEERRHTPFAWGTHDCCLFACDGILAITGLDPAAEMFRGKYRGPLDAARLVRKHGGVEAIAEAQCAAAGFAPLPSVALAQRGDVVLIDTPRHGPALGLCDGPHGVFPGPEGLQFVPVAQCRRAWAVGRSV